MTHLTNKDTKLRRFFFWVSLLGFFILTPLIVAYSLGYKFDVHSHRLQKTGALNVKANPQEVKVYLDGIPMGDSTPFIRRNLLPGTYRLALERQGYYPYRIPVKIYSGSVTEIIAELIPLVPNVERLLTYFDIQKFFILPKFFGDSIIFMNRDGIFEVGGTLDNPQLIAKLSFPAELIPTIVDLKVNRTGLVFWNSKQIWLVPSTKGRTDTLPLTQCIYDRGDDIHNVYWAFKNRYLLIHDGLQVLVIDALHPEAHFDVYRLNSVQAEISFDADRDILYIRDHLPSEKKYSLFRIALSSIIHEKKER